MSRCYICDYTHEGLSISHMQEQETSHQEEVIFIEDEVGRVICSVCFQSSSVEEGAKTNVNSNQE